MNTVLVTGAAGFIGSHVCVELLQAGYRVIGIDNFSNSKPDTIQKVAQVAGKAMEFFMGDVRHSGFLDKIFNTATIHAVIHLAGLKAVAESVEKPLSYYSNNLEGTLHLIDAMDRHGCKKMVFSSSATVYGISNPVPYLEDYPLSAESPYGTTKIMAERVLQDVYKADKNWSIMLLRYFNPIGAHKSGLIGEEPAGVPNNLFPYLARVAAGDLPELRIYGNDYDTIDGTGVRDYIHVMDLANGHLAALQYVLTHSSIEIINLGTGRGTSVLELIAAFEKATGKEIKKKFVPRRAGDIGEYFADNRKAEKLLGWRPARNIEEMCLDGWNFILKNFVKG